jgi:hypothetical protein
MIYKKLLDFQKLNVSIKKTSVGGHHKNTYANIDEVLETIKPKLSELGITLLQLPTETGLKTILVDSEDDSMVEGFLPFVGATDAQKIGSNLTYMRRYSLVSMLGLEAEDDDGEGAVDRTPATVPTIRR